MRQSKLTTLFGLDKTIDFFDITKLQNGDVIIADAAEDEFFFIS
ncbi:MAG TPA: hypothetical protein VJ861_03860 [Treponemataceae bacterium]|nr:hypothetical protein [Treponemataceae bacterium]